MHKFGKEVSRGTFLSDPESDTPAGLDAVTGATCMTQYKIVSRLDPGAFTNGRVKIFFEIQQAWDYSWYYVNGVNCDTEGEPSLLYSTDIDLKKTGVYTLGGTDAGVDPIGYTDSLGNDGNLYTAFYKIDPADNQNKYIFEHAHKMTSRIIVNVK